MGYFLSVCIYLGASYMKECPVTEWTLNERSTRIWLIQGEVVSTLKVRTNSAIHGYVFVTAYEIYGKLAMLFFFGYLNAIISCVR